MDLTIFGTVSDAPELMSVLALTHTHTEMYLKVHTMQTLKLALNSLHVCCLITNIHNVYAIYTLDSQKMHLNRPYASLG